MGVCVCGGVGVGVCVGVFSIYLYIYLYIRIYHRVGNILPHYFLCLRPFLSGQVAYSLASEVIGLLHGLVTSPRAAEVWGTAIREALLNSLLSTPQLVPKLVSFSNQTHKNAASGTPPPSPGRLLQASCITNATFAALGGFKEGVRPGVRVQVVGEGLCETHGVIQSISERKGVASVKFSDDPLCFGANRSFEVPLSRLVPPQKETLPLKQLRVGEELCRAICALLQTTSPSITHAHSSIDANDPSLGLCRLFAEMRTRACMALCYHLQDEVFRRLFVECRYWEQLRTQMTSGNPGMLGREGGTLVCWGGEGIGEEEEGKEGDEERERDEIDIEAFVSVNI